MGHILPIQQVRQLLADRLPGTRTGYPRRLPAAVLPTGIRRLDLALGGGLPLGETTEIVGPGLGSGSAQLIHAVLKQSAREGRFVAFVDGADSLDVDALEPFELARFLWVRCRTVSEALASTDLLLRDRNFPLVVLDLKLNPPSQWQRVSGSVWHRLNRLREHHRATFLVLTSKPTVGGAGQRLRVSATNSRGVGVLDAASTVQSPAELLALLDFEVLRERTGSSEIEISTNPVIASSGPEPFALTG